MQKYKVVISDAVGHDIDNMVYYIRNELKQPQVAYRLAEKIRAEIFSLDTMPTRFSIVNERLWAERGLRKAISGNYIIVYSVEEENKLVTIIRVLYAKSNWEKIL